MLELFAHPFSSYCQKVTTALYANDTPFVMRRLDGAEAWGALRERWPFGKMPLLVDGARTVAEATVIVEHLQLRHPGRVRLLPEDPAAALDVRALDRVFDNYVMGPMMKIVADRRRDADARDPAGVTEAHALLDTAYAWLDRLLAGRDWAAGKGPSLADCAAAPALFYADWVHPIGGDQAELGAYRARLMRWPPFARAVDEARPYRAFFPGGAPDRD